ADLRRHRLRLLGAGPVADDHLRARAREFDRDRTPDPARRAGDEGDAPFQRAEITHALDSASSIFSSAARLFTEIAFTLRSIRLTSPESTLPGPTSTNVRVPSRTSSVAACVNRPGAVSWS